MDPKEIFIKDFDYELPDAKIAKHQLAERDKSKLLIYKNEKICEDIYSNLHEYLNQNSLLIFNDTKVLPARILFEKSSGSIIELFCLEPAEEYLDITSAMMQKQKVRWKCLVGGEKKWKENILQKKIEFEKKIVGLSAKKIKKENDVFLIEFSWNDDDVSFSEVLQAAGSMPLPPYLHRKPEEKDQENYQTIYARIDGSVAAPTAGLHFTKQLFASLEIKKIKKHFITLHVGAGTFKPVKSEKIAEHSMHSEYFEVSKNFIENLINYIDQNIIAVGTTSLRTIESLYWMGVKIIEQKKITDVAIKQWEAYELPQNISSKDSLQNLLKWMHENDKNKIISKTQLMIVPGYKLKIAKGIITNFHQPKSTLLLLIAAIAGKNWKKIYEYALANNFRFLSYGDGCLIWNSN